MSIQLDELPEQIIQQICFLIYYQNKSSGLQSILNIRLVCWNLYDIINRVTLKLALRLNTSGFFEHGEKYGQNLEEYFQYLGTKTNWRFDRLSINESIITKGPKYCGKILDLINNYPQLFRNRVTLVHFNFLLSNDNAVLAVLEEIFLAVANDNTKIELDINFWRNDVALYNFRFLNKVKRIFITVNASEKSFAEKMIAQCSEAEYVKLIRSENSAELFDISFLRNLPKLKRLHCNHIADQNDTLQPTRSQVQILHLEDWGRNVTYITGFLPRIFSNLTYLSFERPFERTTVYQPLAVFEIPPGLVSLKTNASIFPLVDTSNLLRLEHLYLELDIYDDKEFAQYINENRLPMLKMLNLTVNMRVKQYQGNYSNLFSLAASILRHTPEIQVLSIRGWLLSCSLEKMFISISDTAFKTLIKKLSHKSKKAVTKHSFLQYFNFFENTLEQYKLSEDIEELIEKFDMDMKWYIRNVEIDEL